jgi:hypothetical protein
MDETKLKINGRQMFVWAAVDTDTRELLAVYASYYRSSINTMAFREEGPRGVHQQAGGAGGRRAMVSVGARRDGSAVAPHHVRRAQRDNGALQDDEGEDEEVLQQPAFGGHPQPPGVRERLHALVQPPQEAPGTGENSSGGDAIVTVSAWLANNLKS